MTNEDIQYLKGWGISILIAIVKLVQQMPPKPSSSYADEGTLCHLAMLKFVVCGLETE